MITKWCGILRIRLGIWSKVRAKEKSFQVCAYEKKNWPGEINLLNEY